MTSECLQSKKLREIGELFVSLADAIDAADVADIVYRRGGLIDLSRAVSRRIAAGTIESDAIVDVASDRGLPVRHVLIAWALRHTTHRSWELYARKKAVAIMADAGISVRRIAAAVSMPERRIRTIISDSDLKKNACP